MDFRLLVETPDPYSRPLVIAGDKHLSITGPLDISSSSDVPPYICISYVWGSGRVPNPMHPTVKMSDRTLPAVAAAIQNHDPNHSARMIWIDAFCVPIEPLAKRATLESMGFIYSSATQVVVVLSNEAFAAIETISQLDTAGTSSAVAEILDVLENDAWVKSVWTYQEVVNSRDLLFTGEGMVGKFIRGQPFLNRVGQYLQIWQRTSGYNSFTFREKYPFLDAFANVVLDWIMAEYGERSALQVMSQMDNRCSSEPSNRFYSMIGAITTKPAGRKSKSSIESISETFMELCEGKGDYSFMYASTERDKRSGYRWRPAPGILHSTLPWHCLGESQRGEKDPQGIRLKDIVVLKRSASVSEPGRKFVLRATLSDDDNQTDAALGSKMYSILRQLGFTGNEEYLVTTRGFFFPQWPIVSAPLVLWASTTISWRVAVPGMGVVSVGGQRRYIPGVFAGSVPKQGTEEVIIEGSD
jgi:Heterokaryon incompatibility protein (HET)